MKILYDHQIFSVQKYGGISRYFYELMNQFSKMKDISFDLALKNTRNFYILNNSELFNVEKDIRTDNFCGGLQFWGKAELQRFLGRMSIIDHPEIKNLKTSDELLEKSDYDVFHPTYFDNYFINNLKKPFVLTVYDMIYEIYSERFFKNTNRFIRKQKELINKATHIIAISENTKKDIIDICNIGEEKISVVYLGNSFNYTKSDIFDLTLPEKYILYVGDRHIYKNYEFFLKSIKPLLIKDKDLFLICAGSVGLSSKEKQFLISNRLADKVIHLPLIDDKVLMNLYSRAFCFVFPTLYEGFGIPILEAFSCGCPAVLSNTSSLPEVGGDDAAVYFDPEDSESILEAVRNVISSSTQRDNLRQKGYEQLKKFSWRKCAVETKKVYESVI